MTRLLAGSLLLSLASGCTGPEDLVSWGEPSEVRLSKGSSVVLEDGETELSFRTVHPTYRRFDGAFVEDGLPYVKVGDGWLELTGTARIANGAQVFELVLLDCDLVSRSREDYSFTLVESCLVQVRPGTADLRPVVPRSFDEHLSFGQRTATSLFGSSGSALLAARSTGFDIGNVDRTTTPWTVQSLSVGLDLVLQHGVVNLDIASATAPIIGRELAAKLGEQSLGYRVADVANVNTRCDPQCRDVLDVDAWSAQLPDEASPVRILDYR